MGQGGVPPTSRQGFLERLAIGSLRHPIRAYAAWGVLSAIALVAALDLKIETSTDSVLAREGRSWGVYRESVARFGGDEVVVVALQSEVPWDPMVLAEVARLTSSLESAPGIRRVDSIASVPVIRGTSDGALSLDPALEDSGPLNAAGAAEVRESLRGDRLSNGLLVSEDGKAFSITGIVEDVTAEHDAAVTAALDAAGVPASAWVSGGPVFRTRVSELTRGELALFVPLTALLIAVVVMLTYPRARNVVVPLLTGGFGSLAVVATMAQSGVALTLVGAILPSIMLALGCAYVLHVVHAFGRTDWRAIEHESALRALVRPIGLSGTTTAIGFVAMSFVQIDVVRHVGIYGSIGTLVVMLAALTFAPPCLAAGRKSRATVALGWLSGKGPELAFRLVQTRGRNLVIAWVAVALVTGIGIARLNIETDVILWFDHGSRVRDDYEAIRAQFAGISPMNVVIEASLDDPAHGVTEPEVVRALAGLTEFLESQPEMGRAISIADPLRQLHGGFLGDASQPLPGSREEIEQYLLLLESVESVRDMVTPSRDATSVMLRVDANGSNALVSLARRAEDWWLANGVAGYTARTTGIMHEYADSENEIARGQLAGLVFALAAIALLLRFVAGSARLAALALVPNVVPLVLLFGTMGLVGIPVDAGTVLIGCLALGVAVDDTIHLLSAFDRNRASGPTVALRAAFEQSLPPIALTTVSVGLGFAALALSSFTLVQHLGILMGAVMLACFLADILLLAPLLLIAFPEPNPSSATRPAQEKLKQ